MRTAVPFLIFTVLLGCSSSSGPRPWTPAQTMEALNTKYLLSLVKPASPAAGVVDLIGAPTARAGLLFRDELPVDAPRWMRRVDIYGYLTGPGELTRVIVMNGVVLTTDAVTVPALGYAQQEATVKGSRYWTMPTDINTVQLTNMYGVPDQHDALGEGTALSYSETNMDFTTALVADGIVVKVVSARTSDAASASLIATLLAALLSDEGQIMQKLDGLPESLGAAVEKGAPWPVTR